mgnify:CR=1 FL=1
MKKESNSGISFFPALPDCMGNYLYAYRNYVGTFSSGNERGTELSGICRNFYSAGSSYMDYDLSNDDEG